MMDTAESPVITFPVTSAFELPGMRVERSLGITFGLVVRSMGFSKAVTGGISSLRQGEVSQFTVVLEDARRHAIDRMIENAKLLGANAVIAMRFDRPGRRPRSLTGLNGFGRPHWNLRRQKVITEACDNFLHTS
jgi:uncharacterized protein YbjQ (UPF0145 family)